MNHLILLGALTIFLIPLEEVSIVDTASVPALKPQATEHTQPNAQVAPEIAARYGSLFAPKPAFSWSPRTDDSVRYRNWHPHPEMRYIPLKPFNPIQADPGVKRVEAYRKHWKRTENGYDVTEDTVWHWELPKGLQDRWPITTNHSHTDHFMAVVLLPLTWKSSNPVLCYFDAEKGFVWKKELPLQAAYAAVKDKAPVPFGQQESRGPDGNSESAAISRDGSRIIVMIPFKNPCLSLMFVYNNEGDLLKTSALLQRFSENAPSFDRTPGGNQLILRFEHRYDAEDLTGKIVSRRDNEDYLANFEGDLLCRFTEPLDHWKYSTYLRSASSFRD